MPNTLKIEILEITDETADEAKLALKSTFSRGVQTELKQLAEEVFGFKVTFHWDTQTHLVSNLENGNHKLVWGFELHPSRGKGEFDEKLSQRFWNKFRKWMIGYETDANKINWNQSGIKTDAKKSTSVKNQPLGSNYKKDVPAPQQKQKAPNSTTTGDYERNPKRQSVLETQFKTWLVYGSDYNYEQLLDEDVESINWTIHKDANIGDWVYFYLRSPISTIVASGRVASLRKISRKAAGFTNVMPYFANIEIYNIFENPLTYHEMYNDGFIFDRWSLVRSQMQSSSGPQQIPFSVLHHLNDVYGFTPC